MPGKRAASVGVAGRLTWQDPAAGIQGGAAASATVAGFPALRREASPFIPPSGPSELLAAAVGTAPRRLVARTV